jgi:hypothetical protein
MAEKQTISVKGNGMDVFDAFVVLFAALKLTNHPEWTWWQVFSPYWLQLAIWAIAFVVGIVIVAISDR